MWGLVALGCAAAYQVWQVMTYSAKVEEQQQILKSTTEDYNKRQEQKSKNNNAPGVNEMI